MNFLLRAPQDLLEHCTLFQAGQVVTYLKQLGIKNEFLAKRVFAGKKWQGVAMPEASLIVLEFARMLRHFLAASFSVARHPVQRRGWGAAAHHRLPHAARDGGVRPVL